MFLENKTWNLRQCRAEFIVLLKYINSLSVEKDPAMYKLFPMLNLHNVKPIKHSGVK